MEVNLEAVALAKKQVVDLIWKESAIEIPGLTFPQTQEIYDGNPNVGLPPEKAVVVRNLKRAWQVFFENPEHQVRSVGEIIELHSVINETFYGYSSSQLREKQVYITGTDYRPRTPVLREDFEKMLRLVWRIEDAENRAFSLFLKITRTQPFYDGNKRVAQLLANFELIQAGVGFFGIPTSLSEQEHFGNLLVKYYETEDETDLLAYLKNKCLWRI